MSQHKAQALFMLPVLINLALIFSVSSLNNLINKSILADATFPLPTWMFYFTGTLMGPCLIAVIKALPNPSYALCAGALITSFGLLWTGFASGLSQLISFGCFTSFGMCMSFIGSCMYFSKFFVSPSWFLPLCFLTSGSVLMLIQHHLTMFLLFHFERKTFFILSLAVFITTFIPVILLLTMKNNQEDEDECCSIHSIEDEDNLYNTEEVTVSCEFFGVPWKRLWSLLRWVSSIPAVIVWILWAAAVDSTWLSLFLYSNIDSTLWISQYNRTFSLIIVQLFFALLVCAVKLYTEIYTPSKCHLTPAYRIIFSSNYMHLGLLGAAGLVCCSFSDIMDPLHNHLLFSFTFCLQLDDLSDMDINISTRRIWLDSVSHPFCPRHDENSLKKIASDCISTVCHFLCICMMSSISIFLGLPIANAAGLCLQSLEFLPVFSGYGLGILSVFSIGLSLSQPDIWLRRQLNELDSSSKEWKKTFKT